MALIKSVDHKGRQAQYWRIINYSSNFIRGDIVLDIALYFDRDTRLADEYATLEIRQVYTHYKAFTDEISAAGENKDVILSICYGAILYLAALEAQKPEDERNPQYAFWIDAISQP